MQCRKTTSQPQQPIEALTSARAAPDLPRSAESALSTCCPVETGCGDPESGSGHPRSSGTDRSGIDPGADELPQLLLRARCGFTPFARMPAPGDEVICCEVLVQELKAAPAIALRVLQLLAYLTGGFSLPSHLRRGYVPPGVSGYAFVGGPFLESVITICVAGLTEAGRTKDRRLMRVVVIALGRTIARWVAVHAPWIHKDFGYFGEEGTRACILVGNTFERCRGPKLDPRLRVRDLCPAGIPPRRWRTAWSLCGPGGTRNGSY
jgi:hypothetical protein